VHSDRVYDPYRGDYHVWDDREGGYYNRWLDEERHERREYRKLNNDDQKRYWEWRHKQQ
jgi:hypothetical protein